MRNYQWLGLMVLCGLEMACAPIGRVIRTSILEPLVYWPCMDNATACWHNKHRAEEAWGKFACDFPNRGFSEDFAKGFKEGYADYLYAGGPGEPPPVPPRHYWHAHYQTPAGHQAMEDWFHGFRQGALLARESGQRELVTVRPSTTLHTATSAASPEFPQGENGGPRERELPMPQLIPPPSEPKELSKNPKETRLLAPTLVPPTPGFHPLTPLVK